MSITYEALRHAVYRETGIGFGIQNGVYAVDSRDTTTVTIGELANTLLQGTETIGRYIILPDEATATDREKPAGEMSTLASGVIDNVGAAWSGSGSGGDQVEIVDYISLTEFFNITVETLQQFPQRVLTPLGTFIDSDMDTTTDGSSWTASNSALSKATAAANVHSGVRALFVNLSGADGYAESAAVRVQPSDLLYVSAVVRADDGTAGLTLWDNTNGAAIDSVTTTSEKYVHLWLQESAPSGCEEVTVRITGSGATDNIYCDHVCGPYVVGNTLLRAPSWLDEAWRLKKVRTARYTNQVTTNTDDAHSRLFNDYWQIDEVSYENVPGSTQENTLEFRRSIPARDLWIEADRRAYDLTSTTLANSAAGEAYTTGAARDELIYTLSLNVCDYILRTRPTGTTQRILIARDNIRNKLNAITAARENELPPQLSRTFGGFSRV